MFNEKLISILVEKNGSVKKTWLELKKTPPKPFPDFKKIIGTNPDLEKVFRLVKKDFYPTIEKFENYVKTNFDKDKPDRKAIKQCLEWMTVLEDLFKAINDANKSDYLEFTVRDLKRLTQID
jgi:hypothetical protein